MYPDSSEDCSRFWVTRDQATDFESGLGTFTIKYCTRCKMGFTDPYPNEKSSGYLYEDKTSGDFDPIQEGWIDDLKDWVGDRLLRRISPFADFKKVGRVLDYACGNGRFAALAERVFPEAEVDAVDYQEKPPTIFSGGQRGRLKYIHAADFPGSERHYDLIILRHVLEHTHKPVELLRFLASRLEPEGMLYIEVPNLNAGGGRVFKSRWKGYYVPRHIFHYSTESLMRILDLAGLQGEVKGTEMPLMGNMLAIFLGVRKENRIIQTLGILLHPVQLLIERFYSSSSCLCVQARLSPSR